MADERATPGGPLEAPALGFELMDKVIDAFIESQKGAPPGPWERWSFVVGLMGAGAGLLLGVLLGGGGGLWAARVGLAIEVAGLGLSLVLMVKREWHTLRRSKRTFARELDSDFQKYQIYVAELRRYPAAERGRRLRYIRGRRRVMQHRLGLFSGGVERLGVLPVLFVLYLQFRDWQWGDWGMLADVASSESSGCRPPKHMEGKGLKKRGGRARQGLRNVGAWASTC